MSRAKTLALIALVAALPALAAAANDGSAPLCRAEVRLRPEHAVVGQQVLYELRIARRRDVSTLDWDPAPSFPGFRSEWLPGGAAESPVESAGESYRVYRERRAIFPARAGRLAIPPAGLRCRAPGSESLAMAPDASLLVEPVPEAGRPEDWSGLVGRVELGVNLSPWSIELGESLRVSVVLRGPANLWDARAPLPPLAPEIEIFPRPPELASDAGRELRMRRYFTYELVPRTPGLHRVPALRVPWFDPATRSYRVSEAGPYEVVVRRPLSETTAPPGDAPLDPAPVEPAPPRDAWPAAGAIAALALLALAACGVAIARRRRAFAPDRAHAPEAELAVAAARAGDAAALATALRRALEPDLAGAAALSAEEIAALAEAEPRLRRLAELLLRVERARFGAGEPMPTPDEVAATWPADGALRSAPEENA